VLPLRGSSARLGGLRQPQGALLGGRRHRVAVGLGDRADLSDQAADAVRSSDLGQRQLNRSRNQHE
jgi:hypothetical protein